MKFIKTYHGEWINPALVKHFDVIRKRYYESNNSESFLIRADDIPIYVITYYFPSYDNEDWYNNREEASRLKEEWDSKCNALQRETCDKAYAWLDEFVAKLNEEK